MKIIKIQRQSKKAATFKKYRHLFFAALGWLVFFFLFFFLKHEIHPKYYIHIGLDDLIPFVKWFFPVYCSWYVYLFAALLYFGLRSRTDFVRLQTCLFVGMGICIAVYVVYPNAIGFRPVITQNDPISLLMKAMFSIDSSTMVIPSMHVFDAIAVHISLTKSRLTSRSRPLIAFSFVLMVLICASTMFVKQHSALDVICGVAMAAVLYFPFYGRYGRKTL